MAARGLAWLAALCILAAPTLSQGQPSLGQPGPGDAAAAEVRATVADAQQHGLRWVGDHEAALRRILAAPPGPGDTYATAAFYLGSYYNEVGRADDALAALDQGLAAAPDNTFLISERDAALMSLRRFDDVLAATERGLTIAGISPADRARLLRNRGFAFTELKRLDEAEQAYQDSLRYDPGNALAEHELAYIRQLKQGSANAPGVLFVPGRDPVPR